MAMSIVYTVWDGQIVSENRGGVERDYVPDPQGSTIALVDGSHNITDVWTYWPYGELSHSGASSTPFTFLGTLGYFFEIGSLFYVRARCLRSDLTRWLSVDRLWPRQLAYGYVNGTPVALSDPSGLCAFTSEKMSCCAEQAGIAGAIGAVLRAGAGCLACILGCIAGCLLSWELCAGLFFSCLGWAAECCGAAVISALEAAAWVGVGVFVTCMMSSTQCCPTPPPDCDGVCMGTRRGVEHYCCLRRCQAGGYDPVCDGPKPPRKVASGPGIRGCAIAA